jgi:hypothetical protein
MAKIRYSVRVPSWIKPESKNTEIAKAEIAPTMGLDIVSQEFKSCSGIRPLLELLAIEKTSLKHPPNMPNMTTALISGKLCKLTCPERRGNIIRSKIIGITAVNASISSWNCAVLSLMYVLV